MPFPEGNAPGSLAPEKLIGFRHHMGGVLEDAAAFFNSGEGISISSATCRVITSVNTLHLHIGRTVFPAERDRHCC